MGRPPRRVLYASICREFLQCQISVFEMRGYDSGAMLPEVLCRSDAAYASGVFDLSKVHPGIAWREPRARRSLVNAHRAGRGIAGLQSQCPARLLHSMATRPKSKPART